MKNLIKRKKVAKEMIVQPKEVFAKDSVWLLRLVALIQLSILSCMGFFLFVQFYRDPEPIYFAMNDKSQLIDPLPLEKPTMSTAALSNWAIEALMVAFSFNYTNYDKMSKRLSEYFDEQGQRAYIELISKNKYLSGFLRDRLIVSYAPKSSPEIINDGIVKGRYAWLMRVPCILEYHRQGHAKKEGTVLEIVIWRVPETISPVGVKIVDIKQVS